MAERPPRSNSHKRSKAENMSTREPPKSFKTIGAIRRNIEMPCAIPPLIYAEAMIDSGIELWRSVTQPVWKQVFKFARGQSWLKTVKHSHHQAEKDLGPFLAQQQHRLYLAAEFLDKATFYLWVSEVGADFAYNWASLIHEYTPCSKSPHTQEASGASMVGGFLPDHGYFIAGDYIRTFGSGPGLMPAVVTVPKGKKGELLFAIHWPPTPNATYRANARVINAFTGAVLTEVQSGTTTHTAGASTICYCPNLEAIDRDTEYWGQVSLETVTGTFLISFPTQGNMSFRTMATLPIHNPKPPKPHRPRQAHPQKGKTVAPKRPASTKQPRPAKQQATHTTHIQTPHGPLPKPRPRNNQRGSTGNKKPTHKR